MFILRSAFEYQKMFEYLSMYVTICIDWFKINNIRNWLSYFIQIAIRLCKPKQFYITLIWYSNMTIIVIVTYYWTSLVMSKYKYALFWFNAHLDGTIKIYFLLHGLIYVLSEEDFWTCPEYIYILIPLPFIQPMNMDDNMSFTYVFYKVMYVLIDGMFQLNTHKYIRMEMSFV